MPNICRITKYPSHNLVIRGVGSSRSIKSPSGLCRNTTPPASSTPAIRAHVHLLVPDLERLGDHVGRRPEERHGDGLHAGQLAVLNAELTAAGSLPGFNWNVTRGRAGT
jgi:hypothetical protein